MKTQKSDRQLEKAFNIFQNTGYPFPKNYLSTYAFKEFLITIDQCETHQNIEFLKIKASYPLNLTNIPSHYLDSESKRTVVSDLLFRLSSIDFKNSSLSQFFYNIYIPG